MEAVQFSVFCQVKPSRVDKILSHFCNILAQDKAK